jgi:membrane protease YdiL (CAAX protease family)
MPRAWTGALPRARADAPPAWTLFHALAAVAAGLATRQVLELLLPRGGPLVELARLAFVLSAVVGVIVLCAPARPLAALGLARGGLRRSALFGLAAYALFLPFLLAVLWAAAALAGDADAVFIGDAGAGAAAEARDGVLAALHDPGSGLGSVRGAVLVLFAVLGIPLLEETLFRGFALPLLVHGAGRLVGVLATSILFASLHAPSAWPGVFVLSLFLGWVRLRTPRLTGPWSVHALHNGLTLFLAAPR